MTKDKFYDHLFKPNSGSSIFNEGVKQANSRAKRLFKDALDEFEEYDPLAALEELILQHFLNQGYKLEKDQDEVDVSWGFRVAISSDYKHKSLFVILTLGSEVNLNYSTIGAETTKEMFTKAIEHFKGED